MSQSQQAVSQSLLHPTGQQSKFVMGTSKHVFAAAQKRVENGLNIEV